MPGPAPQQIPSYAPIRARIAAGVTPMDQAEATEICLGIAAIAHGKSGIFLGSGDVDDLQLGLRIIQEGLDEFAEEIQDVHALSSSLFAAGLALGIPKAEVAQRLHAKLTREFFELPDTACDSERGAPPRPHQHEAVAALLVAVRGQRPGGVSAGLDFRQSLRMLREMVVALGLQDAIRVRIP